MSKEIILKFNEQYYIYLDELRESGTVNMFAAPARVKEQFNMDKQMAQDVVKDWMDTFSDRKQQMAHN